MRPPDILLGAYFLFTQYREKLIVEQVDSEDAITSAYPFSVLENEFKGKRVLVTGGTKGMGEAIVRRFTLSGATVAATARSPLPHGQNPSIFVQADIGTAEGVKKLVDRIEEAWQGLDILIIALADRKRRTAEVTNFLFLYIDTKKAQIASATRTHFL